VQERANSSPGLQAFLEKKGDEHAFSCLYLIAGMVCLYAAFSHGEEFCAVMPASDLTKTAPVLATAPRRALLGNKFTAIAKTRMSAMKRNMLDEEPAAEAPVGEAAAEPGTPTDGGNSTEVATATGEASNDDADDEEDMPDMAKKNFLGPQGWVVTWLTVEGFTALGLPLVSIVMLLMRLHENACVSCILYLVAVFQALWLIGYSLLPEPRLPTASLQNTRVRAARHSKSARTHTEFSFSLSKFLVFLRPPPFLFCFFTPGWRGRRRWAHTPTCDSSVALFRRRSTNVDLRLLSVGKTVKTEKFPEFVRDLRTRCSSGSPLAAARPAPERGGMRWWTVPHCKFQDGYPPCQVGEHGGQPQSLKSSYGVTLPRFLGPTVATVPSVLNVRLGNRKCNLGNSYQLSSQELCLHKSSSCVSGHRKIETSQMDG